MKNILVFPCGSEIALEVYRSVNNSTHFNLIGASSVSDHGKFVYENYIGNVPFITSPDFLPSIKKIVIERKIDAIYPAMDAVVEILKSNEKELGCKVISSSAATAKICLSKSSTYRALSSYVKTPKIYMKEALLCQDNKGFPVFAKPDIGYGSRGAKKIDTPVELLSHLEQYPSCILMEYLPGKEFTVDCFTSSTGELLFSAARERCRIMNGISVNTRPVKDDAALFENFAQKINRTLAFCGAWFFQVKYNAGKELTLLEVACRLGGSSSLFRAQGINFALMSLFCAFDIPVSVLRNSYDVELDRALDNRYKLGIGYNEVFVDFDDCLLLKKKYINTRLVEFLFRCINKGIKITLLSRHDDTTLDPLASLLDSLRIKNVFDRIIHIKPTERKADYIDNANAIFIDDSFAERRTIAKEVKIPVFSVDMIEVL